MANIALYHSVLGVRAGVTAAADLLRAAGHTVRVVDQYGGRVFDSYEKASEFAMLVGYPALMQLAVDSVVDLPADLVYAGFSNGGGMSQYVATNRPGARGVVMMSGAADPNLLGLAGTPWPVGVPAQIHYAYDDPFRLDDAIAAARDWLKKSDSPLEQYDYVGKGHLFTDESLADEYEPDNAALLWPRVLRFLDEVG
jgi:dienelactone hydrolase